MVTYMGWKKGQRASLSKRCRKCVLRPETDTSLSRFYCWTGVPSMADAHACGRRKLKAFRPKETADETA